MRKIAYYISDYGFGHATRSLAIIRKLLETSTPIYITICTSFSLPFIKDSLSNANQTQLSFRHVQNDIGFVLQNNSIEPDRDAFQKEYEHYLMNSKDYVDNEVSFLRQNHIDLVIGDIPPFPFLAADQLNIPSIGISNFTWYTAYQELVTEEQLLPLVDAYRKMSSFIKLAGHNEPEWLGVNELEAGFFSRELDAATVEMIKRQLDPTGERIVVYFGLGMKISVEELKTYPIWSSENCVFIISNNTNVEGDNIFKIPLEETETQNYIAASDLVVSKPGWGTISEALETQKPLLLITRSNMREDENTLAALKKYSNFEMIAWEDLKQLRITDQLVGELKKQLSNVENIEDNSLDTIVELIFKNVLDK